VILSEIIWIVVPKTFFIIINVTTTLDVELILLIMLAFKDVTLSLKYSKIIRDFNHALNRLYTTLVTRSWDVHLVFEQLFIRRILSSGYKSCWHSTNTAVLFLALINSITDCKWPKKFFVCISTRVTRINHNQI